MSPELHRWLTLAVLAAAPVTFVLLLLLDAPYGRHVRRGWGPTIPDRVGWVLFESPSVVAFLALFAAGARGAEPGPLLLLAAWQLHYVHRTFVFPFRKRASGKRMPLLVAAFALLFTTVNASINGWQAGGVGGYEPSDPRLLLGLAVFAAGMAANLHADTVLIRLRGPGETGYRIPRGGLYRWVSCPNYLGEIVQWLGWALATWSLPGLAFALYTVANLGPRAVANHRWYRERFPDYPPERRALIPGLL